MKKTLCLVLSLLMLLAACLPAVAAEDVGELKIRMFKVGKGDCFVLRTEHHAVMIDTAEDDDYAKIIEWLDEKEITHLDYLIITNFSKNHIGSVLRILSHVTVGRVLQPDYEKTSSAYTLYTRFFSTYAVAPTTLKEDMSFTLDAVTFDISVAKGKDYLEDEDADYSLVTSIRHGDNTFLFAGNVRSERIAEMLQSGVSAHTFLKVPNYGQFESNSAEFFKAVSPKFAVIPCSDKNPAAQETLDALAALGTRVYETRNGSLALTSDGHAITFKQ